MDTGKCILLGRKSVLLFYLVSSTFLLSLFIVEAVPGKNGIHYSDKNQCRNVTFRKEETSKRKLETERTMVIDVDQPTKIFLQTILNAAAVFGIGALWIKEFNTALGSPILTPLFFPPTVIIGLVLLFAPKLYSMMTEYSLIK